MKMLGERIKKRRDLNNLPLNETAKQIGVTSSCLSQIESGKSYPSILTLKKIADTLDTTVGELVGEKEQLGFEPLIKKDERKFIKKNKNGTGMYLLSNHDPNKQMEPIFLTFEENSNSKDILSSHTGQLFCYTINGKIEITLNKKKYILKKGDCFYLNTNENHSITNKFNGISRMVAVFTPPNI